MTNVKEILTTGKVVTVKFFSRTNGSPRTINGRVGVTKGLNGAGARYDAAAHNLVRIFTMAADGRGVGQWRSVPVDGVFEIRANGLIYDDIRS